MPRNFSSHFLILFDYFYFCHSILCRTRIQIPKVENSDYCVSGSPTLKNRQSFYKPRREKEYLERVKEGYVAKNTE